MPTDLTIHLDDHAGYLAVIDEALGMGRKTMKGGYGFLSTGQGTFHLLVQDVSTARRVLEENKLTVFEEQDSLVIIANMGEKATVDISGGEMIAPNLYTIKVPDNGSIKITTRIEGEEKPDDTSDAPGCRYIIVALLRWLHLVR